MKKITTRASDSDRAKKELIKLLKNAEDYLADVTKKVGELRDSYEFPYMIEEIEKQIISGSVKKITTALLQRKYKIGYIRATRLLDALQIETK